MGILLHVLMVLGQAHASITGQQGPEKASLHPEPRGGPSLLAGFLDTEASLGLSGARGKGNRHPPLSLLHS